MTAAKEVSCFYVENIYQKDCLQWFIHQDQRSTTSRLRRVGRSECFDTAKKCGIIIHPCIECSEMLNDSDFNVEELYQKYLKLERGRLWEYR